MLQLTPLEKTAAGQEVFQMGIKEGEQIGLKKGEQKGIKKGEQIGLKKGEVIGKILLAQQLLRRPRTAERDLAQKDDAELAALFAELETALLHQPPPA